MKHKLWLNAGHYKVPTLTVRRDHALTSHCPSHNWMETQKSMYLQWDSMTSIWAVFSAVDGSSMKVRHFIRNWTWHGQFLYTDVSGFKQKSLKVSSWHKLWKHCFFSMDIFSVCWKTKITMGMYLVSHTKWSAGFGGDCLSNEQNGAVQMSSELHRKKPYGSLMEKPMFTFPLQVDIDSSAMYAYISRMSLIVYNYKGIKNIVLYILAHYI